MADSDFKHSNNGKDQSLAEPAASFLKEYILVLQRARSGNGKANSWRGEEGRGKKAGEKASRKSF